MFYLFIFNKYALRGLGVTIVVSEQGRFMWNQLGLVAHIFNLCRDNTVDITFLSLFLDWLVVQDHGWKG